MGGLGRCGDGWWTDQLAEGSVVAFLVERNLDPENAGLEKSSQQGSFANTNWRAQGNVGHCGTLHCCCFSWLYGFVPSLFCFFLIFDGKGVILKDSSSKSSIFLVDCLLKKWRCVILWFPRQDQERVVPPLAIGSKMQEGAKILEGGQKRSKGGGRTCSELWTWFLEDWNVILWKQ